ncbi:MAG: hypothetical protein DHS20C15_27520 [Planctomycetota bacterium]|nr:MAG: hypothetical protein DHS20C15_27520 [Planctomycetota bacterium]
MRITLTCLLAPCLLLGLASSSTAQTAVDFESGAQGWSINGLNTITATGGNPGARIRYPNPVDNFGVSARNSTSAAFLGDYTAKGEVKLSIDFLVDFIQFFGTPVPRDLVVILSDDDGFMGSDPAYVWANLGTLNGNGMPWTTFSADVTDVFSDTLPAGWNGGGAEDPMTFEPILPAGRTWTNVLQGVDRIEFTTFVPGFFFGFANFDLSIDNVEIEPLTPPAWTDQGSALAGVAGNPRLAGTGTLASGSPTGINLARAAPSAPVAMFAGFSSTPQAFKGGTLVPFPQVIQFGMTNASGMRNLAFPTPAGLPSGTEIWVQYAISDLAAVSDVALSNAIRGIAP